MADLLTKIAPILRGLLAQATGDDDQPHRPPILKAFTDDAALAFAADGRGKPAFLENSTKALLKLERLKGEEGEEEIRALLTAAVAQYQAQQQTQPDLISLPGVGVFQSSQPASLPGQHPRLAGRVALITGAAGAIGYGMCRGLLAQGMHVAITDLAGERLDQFVGEFKEFGPRTMGVPLDVTDPGSVARGFASVVRQWGGVDVVVVNAGMALACPLTEIDLEAFRRLERVNVEGTLLVLAEAGRLFARQEIGGDVILISTKNVFAPGAGFGAYSATKAGAHQLARIASLEFAALGVRVNMVAPDAVFSGGSHASGLWAEVGPSRMKARGLDAKGLEEYYRNRNLLKARVTAEHVANAVIFFASRQTPTTGACIPVDGGLPDATPR
jgi:NAD(P)-dependent dehydrogenase (short-subunit alcohol dehydrogenase family)